MIEKLQLFKKTQEITTDDLNKLVTTINKIVDVFNGVEFTMSQVAHYANNNSDLVLEFKTKYGDVIDSIPNMVELISSYLDLVSAEVEFIDGSGETENQQKLRTPSISTVLVLSNTIIVKVQNNSTVPADIIVTFEDEEPFTQEQVNGARGFLVSRTGLDANTEYNISAQAVDPGELVQSSDVFNVGIATTGV